MLEVKETNRINALDPSRGRCGLLTRERVRATAAVEAYNGLYVRTLGEYLDEMRAETSRSTRKQHALAISRKRCRLRRGSRSIKVGAEPLNVS